MTFNLLECVVLNRDLPEQGLQKGDLGVIVETYEADGIEVEFVTASGMTRSLLTLKVADVRRVGPDDMISVRPLKQTA